jgi:hypothetical protein
MRAEQHAVELIRHRSCATDSALSQCTHRAPGAKDLAVAATNARETDAIHLVLIYNCCLYKSALLAAHGMRRRFS